MKKPTTVKTHRRLFSDPAHPQIAEPLTYSPLAIDLISYRKSKKTPSEYTGHSVKKSGQSKTTAPQSFVSSSRTSGRSSNMKREEKRTQSTKLISKPVTPFSCTSRTESVKSFSHVDKINKFYENQALGFEKLKPK